MKYVVHSILSLALITLAIVGCSDTTTSPTSSEDAALPVSESLAKMVVTFDPSGDMSGVTDANAIENALISAAPRDVIKLAKGTFYINRTLVAPVGFNGTLRGAGKHKTMIVGVGTASAPFGNTLINFPGGPGLIDGSSFFFFPQPSRYLTVSDLATSLPDNFVAEVNEVFDGSKNLVAFFTVQLGSDRCNTFFNNLRLQGTEASITSPPWIVHQPMWGIEVLGVGDAFPSFSSGGMHVVRKSEFSKVGVQATVHQHLKDARVKITKNTFTDLKQINVRWLDGAEVSITKNTMHTFAWGAIVVTQEGADIPGERSHVLIRGNNISTDGYLGIEVGWVGSEVIKPDFDLLIEMNTITKGDNPLGGLPNRAGIQIATGEEGAMVKNNIIRGHGDFGIIADHVNNSVFRGNNLQGFTPIEAHYRLNESNDNRLVLKGDETVQDLGSGNIIIRRGH